MKTPNRCKPFLISVVFIYGCFCSSLSAQIATIDSLKIVLQNQSENDTARINTLITICNTYLNKVNDKAKVAEYVPEIRLLSKKLNYKRGLAYASIYTSLGKFLKNRSSDVLSLFLVDLHNMEAIGDKTGIGLCYELIAKTYYHVGDYEKAVQFDLKSIQAKMATNDMLGVAVSYNGIGSCYFNMGDYTRALEYYLKALKIDEAEQDKFGISRMQLNVACVLFAQNKLDEGLKYMQKSLVLKKEINDVEGIATVYANMGNLYLVKNDYDKAIAVCLKSIETAETINHKDLIYSASINLGNVYIQKNKITEALRYYRKAFNGALETDDKVNLITAAAGIGHCYELKNEPGLAIEYYKKSLNAARKIAYRTGERDACSHLASIYTQLNMYKEALEYNKQLSGIKDTLLSEESLKQTTELNTRYETEKKESEIKLLTKDQQLKDKSLKEQRLVRIGLIIGLGLFLALSFLLFTRYRFKQKANLILEKQKEEIHQKNILITDSIDYAKTIQEAILPDEDHLTTHLPKHFILYKPKAIVSGDFYWIGKKGNQIICAVADCTGHGVPGAFMSLLGHNILENVIQRDTSIHPGAILTSLNEEIVLRFSKGKELENVKHGMDIAIISIDETYRQLNYAGARNSLYIVRDKKLLEIKADKMSTGIVANDRSIVKYENHTYTLQKDDMLYLFSDGFPDQKGGPDKKKFYYQPFKDLLTEISALPVDEQRLRLDETISKWIGTGEQIDDILVMGIKITENT